MTRMTFDFNPLDLRSPKGEAVATALDLLRNPDTSPNTINVLAPSHAALQHLSSALDALPAVSHTVQIDSFVPEDQQPKLALIRDADDLLDPTLNTFLTKPPPSDQEVITSLRDASSALQSVGVTAGYHLFNAAPYILTLLILIITSSPRRIISGAPGELAIIR